MVSPSAAPALQLQEYAVHGRSRPRTESSAIQLRREIVVVVYEPSAEQLQNPRDKSHGVGRIVDMNDIYARTKSNRKAQEE
jgi:hypothetical protein